MVCSSGTCSRYSEKLTEPSQVSGFGKRFLRSSIAARKVAQAPVNDSDQATQPEFQVFSSTPLRLYIQPIATPETTTNPQHSQAWARSIWPCSARYSTVPANIVAKISKVSKTGARLLRNSSTSARPATSRAPIRASAGLPLSMHRKPITTISTAASTRCRVASTDWASVELASDPPNTRAIAAKVTAMVPLRRCQPSVNRPVTRK